MPKKLRTTKRAPPKRPQPPSVSAQQTTSVPFAPYNTNLPYLNNPGVPSLDLNNFVPPPSIIDPNDPNYPSALTEWSASALGKLNQLPKLSQDQLSALAGAAAGMGSHNFFAGTAGGHGIPANTGKMGAQPGPIQQNGSTNLPIDLPASLAALFEAKLTLDREKAKLLKMQKELKAHRDEVLAANGQVKGSIKGKEVAVDDDYEECTCGRHGHTHDYPASAHSGEVEDDMYCYSDEDCYDCDCDCHHDGEYSEEEEGYIEEEGLEDDHGHDHHCHHHHHHHRHDHDHDHHHAHDHHVHDAIDNVNLSVEAMVQPRASGQPGTVTNAEAIAAQVRTATAQLKSATAEANRAAASARQWTRESHGDRPAHRPVGAGRSLAEDPERLDELVRELFNWIKAVVWTIEQAALVSGRRTWASQPA